jgi:hypothetical protein
VPGGTEQQLTARLHQWLLVSPGPASCLSRTRYRPIVSTKAGRRTARERVSAYHQSQLAELLGHVGAAIGRYRAGEIDAYAANQMIRHYHRTAGELWKFRFARGGGTHAELIAGLLDRMTAEAEAIDWVGTCHIAKTPVIRTHTRCGCAVDAMLGPSRTVATPHHG